MTTTVPLTAETVAAAQRRTRRVLMVGQVLAGLGMGSTLSIGAILAAQISGSPAFRRLRRRRSGLLASPYLTGTLSH